MSKCVKCGKSVAGQMFWNGAYKGMGVYHLDCRPEEAYKPMTTLEEIDVRIKNTHQITKKIVDSQKA